MDRAAVDLAGRAAARDAVALVVAVRVVVAREVDRVVVHRAARPAVERGVMLATVANGRPAVPRNQGWGAPR